MNTTSSAARRRGLRLEVTPLEGRTVLSAFGFDAPAGPVVSEHASPTTLWPPNNKFVLVTVTGHVSDQTAPVPRYVSYRVIDKYHQDQPRGFAPVNAAGNYRFVVPLLASRLGQDKAGRYYVIDVTAVDANHRSGTAAAVVVVPHDQGNHNGDKSHSVVVIAPPHQDNNHGIKLKNGNGNGNGNGHGHGGKHG